MSDQSAPRCWRARAAVYRAEALMRLGFGFEARRALVDAGRMLNEPADADCHVQEDDEQRESYETLEALVAWNVAMGKISLVFNHLPSPKFPFVLPTNLTFTVCKC